MPVSVRPPDVSAIDARKQCGGNWSFWFQCGNEFLDGAIVKLEQQVERDSVAKAAHSLKTGAELLCMGTVAHAAFELEKASKHEADELELLELQSVLLEHVLALKICLEASSIRHNPDVALEAVNGHFDLLRKATAVPVITSTDNEDLAEELAHTFPSCSSGSGFRSAPCPPRIAVVSRDQTTRRIIAAALTSSIDIEVAAFERLEHVAADEAPVVVICTCPEMPFRCSTILPRVSPKGTMRGFVIVGDVDMVTQEAIYTRMWGWCDHVRMPLVAPELIRRIQSVFVSTQSSAVNSSWSGPRHT